MLKPNAQKNNVNISIEGSSQTVYANHQMMEELVYNLCDNAIRYNKTDGKVYVRVCQRMMTDSQNTGDGAVDEYKADVKAKLEEQKQNEIKRAYQDEAIDKIVDKSTMELPDAMIDTQCENMINQFAQQMAQQGLSMDQYLQFSGLTLDQLKEQVRPDAITRIKSSLVLEQIAKEENIEITDADVDAEIEKMATMYNMEADKLKEYMGEDEKENMKQDLAVQKAVELITESVKPRAKAKTKKEKEAEAETEAAE